MIFDTTTIALASNSNDDESHQLHRTESDNPFLHDLEIDIAVLNEPKMQPD